jgi:hypothetical protein
VAPFTLEKNVQNIGLFALWLPAWRGWSHQPPPWPSPSRTSCEGGGQRGARGCLVSVVCCPGPPYFWIVFGCCYSVPPLFLVLIASLAMPALHASPPLCFRFANLVSAHELGAGSVQFGEGRRFFRCFRADLKFLAACCVHWPVYIMAAKLSDSHLFLYNSSFTTIQHFVFSWFYALPSSLQFMIFSLPRFCALVLWGSLQFLVCCPALCVICPTVVHLLPCDCAL